MTMFKARDLKLAMTASNEVFFPKGEDYNNWKQDVNSYIQTKKEFQGVAEPYVKNDHVKIKKIESFYNPITQKYNDPVYEKQARQNEYDSFVTTLAKNKDNALRYEQTYNVINFENKLTGLEDRPDYPKEKPWYFRPNRDSDVDYNIITNYDL